MDCEIEPMNAEQITTIITNVLTGGGVVFFLGMWIRSLKKQLDVQKDTLEAVKTQVSETQKIGDIYRKLFEELPTEVEKWKVAILKLKDERIAELEKANKSKDGMETSAVGGEFERVINAMDALELRMSTVNQLTPVSASEVRDLVGKPYIVGAMTKNESAVNSAMSGYAEEDLKTAVSIWSLLYG